MRWSGWRGSNPRPRRWHRRGASPTELHPRWWARGDLNATPPLIRGALDQLSYEPEVDGVAERAGSNPQEPRPPSRFERGGLADRAQPLQVDRRCEGGRRRRGRTVGGCHASRQPPSSPCPSSTPSPSQSQGEIRYAWDPFVRSQRLLDGATRPGKGVRTETRLRHHLKMVSEYTSFRPPTQVGMRMVDGPWFFAAFGGGWSFKETDDGRTEATWRYTSTIRPSWLAPIGDRIGLLTCAETSSAGSLRSCVAARTPRPARPSGRRLRGGVTPVDGWFGGTRTHDLRFPKAALYQAEPQPVGAWRRDRTPDLS